MHNVLRGGGGGGGEGGGGGGGGGGHKRKRYQFSLNYAFMYPGLSQRAYKFYHGRLAGEKIGANCFTPPPPPPPGVFMTPSYKLFGVI